jgi:Bestrophin, RFP-TM, chloride channel
MDFNELASRMLNVMKCYVTNIAALLVIKLNAFIIYGYVMNENQQNEFQFWNKLISNYSSNWQLPMFIWLVALTIYAAHRFNVLHTSMPGTSKVLESFVSSLTDDITNGANQRLYRRWLLLSWALTLRIVSKSFRMKYPHLESFNREGLLWDNEMAILWNYPIDKRPLVVIEWMMMLLRYVKRRTGFSASDDYSRNVEIVMSYRKSTSNLVKCCRKNLTPLLFQMAGLMTWTFTLCSLLHLDLGGRRSIFKGIVTNAVQLLQSCFFYTWWRVGHVTADPFGTDEQIDVVKLFDEHKITTERIIKRYDDFDANLMTFEDASDLFT